MTNNQKSRGPMTPAKLCPDAGRKTSGRGKDEGSAYANMRNAQPGAQLCGHLRYGGQGIACGNAAEDAALGDVARTLVHSTPNGTELAC